MKKHLFFAALGILLLVLFSGCSTTPFSASGIDYRRVNGQSKMKPSVDSKPFHVIRTEQLKPLAKGATIGIVSAPGSGAFSIFMSAALESKGLLVREMNLYSLLPPDQQYLTDPKNRYTFLDTLVQQTIEIIKETGVPGAEDTSGNINLDNLLNKMYGTDDLVSEKQRVDHYLELITSLRSMIKSLNVDYILVGGSPYTGLSYSVKMYDTRTLDVVFSNIIVSDQTEWRKIIPVPPKSDKLSYEFGTEKEPYPFWDLSYCEFLASKLEVR